MTKLNVCELDFEKALTYFQENLLDTDTLSTQLIKLVNFESGRFFTFYSKNADHKKIYEFQHGGIVGSVRQQIKSLLLEIVKLNNRLCCIFDNAASSIQLVSEDPLFMSCGCTCDNEVYYKLTNKTGSIDLINRCFFASETGWHSLCVLSETNLDDKIEKKITLKDIESICLNAKLIVLGAYDGEGYIFWEKFESLNFPR